MPHTETYVDGIWFPSVSTIISAEEKPWLKVWREKWGSLAERKMKIANAIGTTFHDCVEQYLDRGYWASNVKEYPSCNTRVNKMMKIFEKWAESIDGSIDYTELKVISRIHIYSGTLDAVGKIDRTPIIIDWKTSSRIYDEMQLQLSAYAFAYNEMHGTMIKNGLIVHVSKDKPHFKLTTKTFKLGKRVFNKFLELRAMFDDMKTPDFEEGSLNG